MPLSWRAAPLPRIVSGPSHLGSDLDFWAAAVAPLAHRLDCCCSAGAHLRMCPSLCHPKWFAKCLQSQQDPPTGGSGVEYLCLIKVNSTRDVEIRVSKLHPFQTRVASNSTSIDPR